MINEAEGKQKNGWSKAQEMLPWLQGVLLPVAVAAVGGLYTYVQNNHNERNLQQEKDRADVTSRAAQASQLLIHLASTNDRERLLSIKLAEQLGKDNLLPQELVPVLIEIASSDPSAAVSRAAGEALADTKRVTTVAPNGNVSTQSVAPATLQTLPARVYVHIRSEEQRPVARVLSSALEQGGFNVPGIQRVEVGPARSELRYFAGSSQEDIQGIEKVLAAEGLSVKDADLSSQYKGLRSRHYELWLAPDYSPKPK
jgi:hypothetical protein